MKKKVLSYNNRTGSSNSGQALVLVLLSLAVILTLVLFILARSITDVAVSSRQEESVRAFSAAEAGIEKALIVGAGSGLTAIGDAKYTSNVTDVATGATSFVYPISLASGDTSTLWFVSHDPTTGDVVCNATNPCLQGRSLKVCWGKPGTPSNAATTPAIEVSVYYELTPGDPSTVGIARVALDPDASRATTNLFEAVPAGGCTVNGQDFQFTKTINMQTDLAIPGGAYLAENGLQFAKINMFYNTDQSQPIAFDVSASVAAGGTALPSQGTLIESSGTAGQSNRKLSVFQGWAEVPMVFESALYSSSGIVK